MEYQEIISRKDEILARPVHPIPKEKLASEQKLYAERNKRSIAIFEKAKGLIPGGVEHNLSQNKPFPLAMDRAKGYKMWDVDGNEYIDYLMCGAPIMLGHSFDPLDEKIIEIIRRGDGPLSPVRHRGGHGRYPYCPGLYGETQDYQDRRQLSRVVRSDGLLRSYSPYRSTGVQRNSC